MAETLGQSPDFRMLFEASPDLYLALNPDLVIVAVSDSYLRATMTERDAIVGRNLFVVFPDNPADSRADGVDTLTASLERVFERRQPDTMGILKYDIRRPTTEGGGFEERYWSSVNSPIFDAGGELAYVMHRTVDVTDFVRLKQQGLDRYPDGEGLRARWEVMETEVYRRAEEVQEANRQLYEVNRQLRELQAELEARVEARTVELKRWVEEHKRTSTALQASEEELRRAQKLEAIGRLAGGIAHDFNNFLSAILGYAELILEHPESQHVRSEVEEIQRAGQRAAELTRQLLAFSRQQVLEPKVLDLNAIVSDMSKILQRVVGEHIEIRTSLTPDLGNVKADRSQIEQVIVNLVVNARDAMPSGGRLVIESANVTLDEGTARELLGLRAGAYVVLSVSDDGVGMDTATRARIFDPFFTTKERGKGTGLGLSTVFGIVQQSGGAIAVVSEPGAGSTFNTYFPRVDAQVEDGVTASSRPALLRGTESVLLVEDDAQVRQVAGEILRRAGYRVLEAETLDGALTLSDQNEIIDLLLSDVVMPKVNGREVAEGLRARRPALKVLFMSGYTDDVVIQHGVQEASVAFIQKPFSPISLLRKVRDVLDNVRGAPAEPTR